MRILSATALGLALVISMPALAQHHDRGHDGRGGWHGRGPGGPRHYAYSRGYRFDRGYRGWSRYDGLPPAFRSRYGYNPRYRYVYRDNVVYVVDPTTRLVRDVVDLLSYR